MYRLRTICCVAVMTAIWTTPFARACSVQVHYTQSEINHAHMKLYEHEVKLLDHNPVGFEEKNPLVGQLLTSSSFFQSELSKWEAHPIRFEHENPFLWRVLDGDRLFHIKHPTPDSIPNPMPVIETPPLDVGPMIPSPPPIHDNGGPPSGPQFSSVPEPSAFVLMIVGVVVSVIGFWHRRT